MPDLDDITYSQDATVAAFRDYYRFLATMYLDETLIQEPPEGGWPHIISNRWDGFNKTEDVFSLLRHLPYLTSGPGQSTVPYGHFTNYAEIPSDWDGEAIKDTTELVHNGGYEVPPHIIGLVDHRPKCPRILLDTQLGVVYWPDCLGEIQDSGGPEQVWPDPYDWHNYHMEDGSPILSEDQEEQAEWRASGGVWTIEGFFEMLKYHFRELHFLPSGSGQVTDIWVNRTPERQAQVDKIVKAYREHGWPAPGRFRKEDCHAAIRLILKDEGDFP